MGLNCVYHESSVCILKNGELASFIEEERLNRIKHAKPARIDNAGELPLNSIDYCLKAANIDFKDVDYIAYSLDPHDRLQQCVGVDGNNKIIEKSWGTPEGEQLFFEKNMNVLSELSKLFKKDIKENENFFFIKHHLAHAAGTYYSSGYESAALLVADGIAESKSTWIGAGNGTEITKYFDLNYPNSLGFLWEKMSEFLGFSEYDAEKVMGLASYGDYQNEIFPMRKLVDSGSKGAFAINNDILLFRTGDFSELEKLFLIKRRNKEETLIKKHQDIAAALQFITNEIILNLAIEVKHLSGEKRLCMAGGTTLNVIANTKIAEANLFDEIYIQPPANDGGTSIGAAFYLWANILKNKRPSPVTHAYLGPAFSNDYISQILENTDELEYKKADNIGEVTAKLLAEGNLVAWFQGAMEAGPRALGHRSLLADPRRPDVMDLINKKVKLREYFRPLAPSVLEEESTKWFQIGPKIPDPAYYMLMAFKVKPEKKYLIPAVVHVDDTSRIQVVNKKISPEYWGIINEFFKLTQIPMILNTSWNIQEPIVCSPEDAIKTFLRCKVEYLVLENYLCTKKQS